MQNKKYTVGVILGNANSPHTIETIKGIKEAAKELSVNIMCYAGVHSSYFFRDYFNDRQDEDFDYQASCIYDYISLSNVDALILSYGTLTIFLNNRELSQFFRKFKDIPTVILENRIDGSNMSYIIGDNYAGEKLVVNHLIKYHGYKNIIFLSGPSGNMDADERLKAYKDAMNEASLECDDTMIAFGDFSERVEREVNELLDNNPMAEAIVCANDKMAGTVYKILVERKALFEKAEAEGDTEGMHRYYKHVVGRGILDGHGIAVTGYDNVPLSENMDPPLTTVVQNAYSNGYKAVFNAVAHIEGKVPDNVISAPKLIIRNSCGCDSETRMDIPILNDYYRLYPEIYSTQVAKAIRDGMILSDVSEKVSDAIFDRLNEIVLKHTNRLIGVDSKGLSPDELVEEIKDLLNGEFAGFISLTSFATTISDYVSCILRNSKNPDGKNLMIEATTRLNEYIHSRIYSDTLDTVSVYEHRTWFMPLISRDMANYLDSTKEMYKNAMMKMNVLDMGNTYLFMLKEPIKHGRHDIWKCPEELRLVAYSANGEITSYDYDDAPIVDKDNPFDKCFVIKDKPYYASIMDLYSGEYQYGVLLAEIEPENVLSLYYASVQISTALKYCEMARVQRHLQKQLEHMIVEVEQKNEILRSLSEYDQLTGCLNRRGFLENAINAISENIGRKAIVIFADLDHLKEINDRYGHVEGDFAIENIANILKNALPDSTILSRLGGDEFVGMIICDDTYTSESLIREVKEMTGRFNAMLTKPYYVECSVGTTEFTCSEEIKIEEVMDLADEALYEAKKLRRESVVKKVQIW